MPDDQNPYQSPSVDMNTVNNQAVFEGLSHIAFIYLKKASPWLRFIGIMGFISCGFVVLGAIALVLSTSLSSDW